MVQLVAATANPAKLAEITEILGDAFELLPRPDDVGAIVEDAPDLEGNARLKASTISAATGVPAVADDTGLEVVALDGAPGVRSARFAGEHATDAENVEALLAALDGVSDRRARFRTVAAVWGGGLDVAVVGTCEGRIATAPRGDAGFGYDPVFVPTEGDGRTFAEMTAVEKHRLSHRGRAFRALAVALGPPRNGPDTSGADRSGGIG
jgi:XTP/dITP diphosphohydrolase